MSMSIREMVAESNRIEGITRPPTDAEIAEFERFVSLSEIHVSDLVDFVQVYQPNARLRVAVGLNVYVGDHVPPPGGLHILAKLVDLLERANDDNTPWRTHIEYETLHPFTDGNGRSGRMLWYWQMRHHRHASLGFLHAFYYQTLQSSARHLEQSPPA